MGSGLQRWLDDARIESILHFGSEKARVALASDPSTDPGDLWSLSKIDSLAVQRAVAANPWTSPFILESFEKRSSELRCIVASRSNLPDHLIWQIIESGDANARKALAENVSLAPRLLMTLALLGDPSLSMRVAINPSTPVDVLARIASEDMFDPQVAVRSPEVQNLLSVVANENYFVVRKEVARNAGASVALVRHLMLDDEPPVYRAAFEAMMARSSSEVEPSDSDPMAETMRQAMLHDFLDRWGKF